MSNIFQEHILIKDITISIKSLKDELNKLCEKVSSAKLVNSLEKLEYYVIAEFLGYDERNENFKKIKIKEGEEELLLNFYLPNKYSLQQKLLNKNNQTLIFCIGITNQTKLVPDGSSVQSYYNLILKDVISFDKKEEKTASEFVTSFNIKKKDLREEAVLAKPYKMAVIHVNAKDGQESQTYTDFYHQIEQYIQDGTIEKFDNFPCFITDTTNVLETLGKVDNSYNILVIIRGGAAEQDSSIENVFNNSKVIEKISQFNGYIISGLGHSHDVTLTDLLAHYAADTPTDAGRYLSEKIKENLEKEISKAKEAVILEETKKKYELALESEKKRYEELDKTKTDLQVQMNIKLAETQNYENNLKKSQEIEKKNIELERELALIKEERIFHAEVESKKGFSFNQYMILALLMGIAAGIGIGLCFIF